MIGMAFARTIFWGSENHAGDEALRRRFWRKLGAVIARVPFAEDLLAAYYCAFDRATPVSVKATLIGAIAYFILPADAVPDMLPMLGFTDDAAMLAAAVRMVADHVTPEHRTLAREKLHAMTEAATSAG
jgi:uncharacterized membrane protein YkvA (DUF1232 family)